MDATGPQLRVDALLVDDIARAGRQAAEAEAAGYHGVFAPEGRHDGFVPLAVAAERTRHVDLGTAVAIGFARTPMTLAHLGHDLQVVSGGRFVLGLGTQIRPHIRYRYSMPWSRPVERMREMVAAIRAIWRCWNEGERLDFRGDFYTHTLMPPLLAPPPSPHGPPRLWVAGVGPKMIEVAGEVGDGLICHPLLSVRYLREVALPRLAAGAARGGRAVPGLAAMVMVATGRTEGEMAAAVAATRAQIAFYSSTPAYRPVLDLHGWGDLQAELRGLTKAGAWAEMADAVDDEMLHTLAVVAPPDELAGALLDRFGGLAGRVSLSLAHRPHTDALRPLLGRLGREDRGGPSGLLEHGPG